MPPTNTQRPAVSSRSAYLLVIHRNGEHQGDALICLDNQSGPVLAALIDAGYDLVLTVGNSDDVDPGNWTDMSRLAGERILEVVLRGGEHEN